MGEGQGLLSRLPQTLLLCPLVCFSPDLESEISLPLPLLSCLQGNTGVSRVGG